MNNKLALIGHNRLGQVATITASSALAGFEAAYLNDLRRFYPWRGLDAALTAVDINWDFGAAVSLDSIILGGTNFTLAALAQLWVGNDPTFMTNLWTEPQAPAFDTGLSVLRPWVQPWGRDVIRLNAAGPVSARYARMRVWDSTNPDNYLRADFNFCDLAWQPLVNYQTAYKAPDQFAGTEGMIQVIRGFTCTLARMKEADEIQILSLIRGFKSIGRMYLIPRPLKPPHFLAKAIMGTFTKAAEVQGVDQLGRYSSLGVEFSEVDI